MAFLPAFLPPVIKSAPPLPLVYVLPPRHLRESKRVMQLSVKEHERSISTQNAKKIAETTLTNYSKQENLMASLSHFAEKALQVSSKDIEIREADEVG